jgi:hypothetical protein
MTMETPALYQLMGGYLHQDFDVVGDLDDNIDLFASDSPALAALLPREVESVLETYTTEDELEAFCDRMGCEVVPLEGEGGYRGWLTQIAERVRLATTDPA